MQFAIAIIRSYGTINSKVIDRNAICPYECRAKSRTGCQAYTFHEFTTTIAGWSELLFWDESQQIADQHPKTRSPGRDCMHSLESDASACKRCANRMQACTMDVLKGAHPRKGIC
jgi:hypothetical protein